MPDISHHANNSPAPVLGHDLVNRAFSRPEGASQSLVDDHHRLTRFPILPGERSSVLQMDPDGLEISIAHDSHERLGMPILRINLALGSDLPGPISIQR